MTDAKVAEVEDARTRLSLLIAAKEFQDTEVSALAERLTEATTAENTATEAKAV